MSTTHSPHVLHSRAPNKRGREEDEEELGGGGAEKKLCLTPDQKSRMLANESRGRLVQLCRSGGLSGALDEDVGLSWFRDVRRVLEGNKFKELAGFVGAERERRVVYPPRQDVWNWTKHFDVKDTK